MMRCAIILEKCILVIQLCCDSIFNGGLLAGPSPVPTAEISKGPYLRNIVGRPNIRGGGPGCYPGKLWENLGLCLGQIREIVEKFGDRSNFLSRTNLTANLRARSGREPRHEDACAGEGRIAQHRSRKPPG